MSSPFVDESLTETEKDLTGLDYNTTYYWRTQCTNVIVTSGWSDVWSFEIIFPAPDLLSPSNNSYLITKTPTFLWGDVENANEYTLQVSTTSDFTTSEINTALTATSYTQETEFNFDTPYYWRLKSSNDERESFWSVVFSFTITTGKLTLDLNQGWNMISSNVAPFSSDIVGIMRAIVDDMILIKNGRGNLYFPVLNINTIMDKQ